MINKFLLRLSLLFFLKIIRPRRKFEQELTKLKEKRSLIQSQKEYNTVLLPKNSAACFVIKVSIFSFIAQKAPFSPLYAGIFNFCQTMLKPIIFFNQTQQSWIKISKLYKKNRNHVCSKDRTPFCHRSVIKR